jgi:hypothetical protein
MRGHPPEASDVHGAISAQRGAVALLAAALGAACEPDPPPEPEPQGPVSLAEFDQWERVADVQDDVFGAQRPADLVCDETLGILPEFLGHDPVLEINTDLCNYATVRQPSLAPLVRGDTVSIRLWHYPLVAPMPSEGYLALALDGEVRWEVVVPIPAEAGLVEGEFIMERDLPAGIELQFHIHNHGNNSYELLGIQAAPAELR